MITKIIIFLLILSVFILCILYFILLKRYKKTKQDISKIYLAIKRLRYGNVHIRVENLNDENLETAVNRMFETILDREMMIKEYQNTLSKKNLSLEEIIKKEQKLQQVKEDFAATLTHDMKVPVIAELNSIEYLLDGRFGEPNQKQKEILKLMKSSNKELKELIENILEVYKIEQQEIKLNLQNNNLNRFLSDTVSEMKMIADENNVKLNCISDNTLDFELKFDPFQLKRVIKNLIQNAISFSPKEEEIAIKTAIENNKVIIQITNKGTGISKEDLELIFNKY